MSKAIYIASPDPNSGKSVITLGLMNMLAGKIKSIAYCVALNTIILTMLSGIVLNTK